MVISGKDTLKTTTDQEGNFSVSKLSGEKFSIQIESMGYFSLHADYSFAEKEKHKKLETFVLKTSSKMLKEVVIKAKPNPVRFMQDTVEYDAAAYRINEGDNVADLIKQFPGMEVDAQYNTKTMGKEMVKLRVDGKDFFTNNIKDFIGRLPAGIVSKIQVIDDFGDEANFTGIKVGEPVKMLNIVTKPGMNRGAFGGASADTGTNDMIGSQANVNLWNASRQSSANANANTQNNGAGNSRSMGIGLNHNDKIGKNASAGFGYGFNNNGSAFSNEQVIESLNPQGNFSSKNQNQGKNGGMNHRVNSSLNYTNNKFYLNSELSGSYTSSDNQNTSLSNQSGLLRQDLKNSNASAGSSPNIGASISLSKKLKNKTNSFSVRSSFRLSSNNNQQNINTNTIYYDKTTGAFLKDSLLNRDLSSTVKNQSADFGFNYSLGLKKPKDTLARRSLNLSYHAALSSSINDVVTFALDNKSNESSFVDSLSTSFSSISFSQSIGGNYNYNSNKMRFNLGINARPVMLSNRDLKLAQTTVNNSFNYSPNVNFSRTITKTKTISINYQGSNNNPSINQLQPIRNTQNLQNIVVGNPDLKSSFSHNLSSNFNYNHAKSGISLQTGISTAATQREIMSHVILIPDTLSSLKQITRYENVNGNYQINGNYTLYLPFKKNKFGLSYSGSIGFSNRAVLFNNQKAFGKGTNFSQGFNGNFSFKKLFLHGNINYSVTNNNDVSSLYSFANLLPVGIGQISAPAFFRTNNFSSGLSGELRLKSMNFSSGLSYSSNHNSAKVEQPIRNTSTLNINLSGRLTFRKSYHLNVNASKTTNYGYSLANSNPLLINAILSKNFFKNQALRMSLQANDLLAQGNNISRTVTGNTIIDNRSQQQTRTFHLSLSYSISRFGGRHFRVDPD